jgi:hypothetical protein
MGHDNFAQEAIGKGNIKVSMSVGENGTIKVILINLLHVPWLLKNLLFVTKATPLGRVFEFGEKKCVVKINQKKVVGIVVKENGLYQLACN